MQQWFKPEWLSPLVILLIAPLYLLQTGYHTLVTKLKRIKRYKRRTRSVNHRKCRNLRIRRLHAYLQTNHGIFHWRRRGLAYSLSPTSSCAPGSARHRRYLNAAKYDPLTSDTIAESADEALPQDAPTTRTASPHSDSLQSYVDSIDVLQHYRQIRSVMNLRLPRRFKRLDRTDPRHRVILLQAKLLKASIRSYSPSLQTAPTQPVVYTSTKPGEPPIVIDTGASSSITPIREDFMQQPVEPDSPSITGLTGKVSNVCGEGIVSWDIEDMRGARATIETEAYHIPDATVRLFSPQSYIDYQHATRGAKCALTIDTAGATLHLQNGALLRFPMERGSNLPIMLTHRALHPRRARREELRRRRHAPVGDRLANFARYLWSEAFQVTDVASSFSYLGTFALPTVVNPGNPVLHKTNWNLTDPQRELLLWHNRLGHINFGHVQSLLAKTHTDKTRLIYPSNSKSSHCPHPVCEACQYAKQKRVTPPSQVVRTVPANEGKSSIDIVNPGQRVSVDLYQSATRGRLPDSYGKEKDIQQFTGGALFVDHATRLVHHTHQCTTTAAETVKSKHAFERFCLERGVTVEEYAADNNPFHSADWTTDCDVKRQRRFLSGVGAHHQNRAERSIQSIFYSARALLLHFAIHWPQQAQANLWPFAVDHAVYLWNHTPRQGLRLSPYELFTGTGYRNHSHLQRLHVFGCPVYVLDPRLQDGKKIPKWERRSRQGVYLGVSRYHSTTVHLVLNPDTGKVTPQYHVVFDDSFSTVYSNGEFSDDVWTSLVLSNTDRHPDAATAPDVIPFAPISSHTSRPASSMGERESSTGVPSLSPPSSPPSSTATPASLEGASPSPEGVVASPSREGASLSPPEGVLSSPEGAPPIPSSSSHPANPMDNSGTDTAIANTPSLETDSEINPESVPTIRRSTRMRRPVQRLNLFTPRDQQRDLVSLMLKQRPHPSGSRQINFRGNDQPARVPYAKLNQQHLAAVNWNSLLTLCGTKLTTLNNFISEHQLNYSNGKFLDYLNPAAFATMANKEDNPTLPEAMASPEAAGFVKAMEIEIQTLIDLDVFTIVDRPTNQKVISGVWALRRKRYPDGSVKKLKARYCARGFEQEKGVDYFETFAPVVMWITVRLLLVMSIIMNLETKQIDYTAAFVHAKIDCLVYVEMPAGFAIPGMVWKLNKSLYGLAQSPRNFFLHTRDQLTETFGFVQSDADPCLFVSDDVICLIYVDDALLFYKDAAAMDNLTRKIKEADVPFREEEDVAGFLGVLIDRRDDGTIHLTQKGLAEAIVDALHLNDKETTPVGTPCTNYLPIDQDGEQALGEFNYASIVGQLNYLAGHSRCDIAMATSQVARYVHAPKRSHEQALVQIGRYLKGTLDKGLILKPSVTGSLKLDIYVDAAFACGWGTEECTNPDAVKSRTGYIIEIAGCPVLWVSKLQSTIATSTMESEYTALSMALRAAIPMLEVFKSVLKGLKYDNKQEITFKATVHEDNQGALILAKLEPGRHTIRSKFYALRLHWFRSWIKARDIQLEFVETSKQKADFLTKPLSPIQLKTNRTLSMGW